MSYHLTPRETLVVQYICEAVPTQQMAELMGCRLGTVQTHIYNVMNKTGMSSRLEIACKFLPKMIRKESLKEIQELERRIRALENQILWGGWEG